jgi:hypothetical protein
MTYEQADRDAFIRLKKQYTNESLEEFVRNDNEKDKIKRYRNRLYQNYDQIFYDRSTRWSKRTSMPRGKRYRALRTYTGGKFRGHLVHDGQPVHPAIFQGSEPYS